MRKYLKLYIRISSVYMLSLDKHFILQAVHLFVDLVSLTQEWSSKPCNLIIIRAFPFPCLNLLLYAPLCPGILFPAKCHQYLASACSSTFIFSLTTLALYVLSIMNSVHSLTTSFLYLHTFVLVIISLLYFSFTHFIWLNRTKG